MLVVEVEKVDVKPAVILPDFLDAVVAPMVFFVTNGVVVRAWETSVVARLIKRCVITVTCVMQVTDVHWGNTVNKICHVNLRHK